MPPKHQRNRCPFSASNVSGMMPLPNDLSTCRPDHPLRRIRSDSSASSVMHHSSHPPACSSARRRISPIVPAKMAPSRSLRDGCETAKK